MAFQWSPGNPPLADQTGTALTGGDLPNGDGALYQVGYFAGLPTTTDPATVPNLWDLFTPISGRGSLNPTLSNTIGDLTFPSPIVFHGYVAYETIFQTDVHNGIPPNGNVRMGVRLFNGTTLAGSTHFTSVTAFSNDWILPKPGSGTGTPFAAPMVLDSVFGVSDTWEGAVPLQTDLSIAAAGGTVVWQDTTTNDWSLAGSWDNSGGGSAPPGPFDIASFPNNPSTVNSVADLKGTAQVVSGLSIDNTGDDYVIQDSGSGALVIGLGGISASGGGTATMGVNGNEVNLILGESQTWNVGAGTTLSYADIDNTIDFGDSTLTKAGAGTLELKEDTFKNIGAATDIVVQAGTLHLSADPGTTDFMVEFQTATIEVMGSTLAIDRAAGHSGVLEVNSVLSGTVSGAGATTLKKYGTGSATINSIISGTGNITMDDSGDTIRLNGDNTYSGTTTVTAGTLLIDGNQSTATGAVSVGAAGILGGSGTVGGATTMAAGGKLAPGTDGTTGTLTFSSTLDSSGATWLIDAVSPLDHDLVDVIGALDITGATLTVSGALSGAPIIIADYGGTLTGTFASNNLPAGWGIDYNYNLQTQIALTATLIPEPSTVVPLAALLAPWMLHRRRRR